MAGGDPDDGVVTLDRGDVVALCGRALDVAGAGRLQAELLDRDGPLRRGPRPPRGRGRPPPRPRRRHGRRPPRRPGPPARAPPLARRHPLRRPAAASRRPASTMARPNSCSPRSATGWRCSPSSGRSPAGRSAGSSTASRAPGSSQSPPRSRPPCSRPGRAPAAFSVPTRWRTRCPARGARPSPSTRPRAAPRTSPCAPAAERGTPLPEGWAVDADGRPTTDPEAALAGALLPFGGYKGANIALLVELLSSMAGGNWAMDAPAVGHGLAVARGGDVRARDRPGRARAGLLGADRRRTSTGWPNSGVRLPRARRSRFGRSADAPRRPRRGVAPIAAVSNISIKWIGKTSGPAPSNIDV